MHVNNILNMLVSPFYTTYSLFYIYHFYLSSCIYAAIHLYVEAFLAINLFQFNLCIHIMSIQSGTVIHNNAVDVNEQCVPVTHRYWQNTTFLFLIQPPFIVFSTCDSVLCGCKCGVCSGSHMLSGIFLPKGQMLCDAPRKWNEEIKRMKKKERKKWEKGQTCG